MEKPDVKATKNESEEPKGRQKNLRDAEGLTDGHASDADPVKAPKDEDLSRNNAHGRYGMEEGMEERLDGEGRVT